MVKAIELSTADQGAKVCRNAIEKRTTIAYRFPWSLFLHPFSLPCFPLAEHEKRNEWAVNQLNGWAELLRWNKLRTALARERCVVSRAKKKKKRKNRALSLFSHVTNWILDTITQVRESLQAWLGS